jgi:hypothetical protein
MPYPAKPQFLGQALLQEQTPAAMAFLRDWYGRRKITDPYIAEAFDKDKPHIMQNLKAPPQMQIVSQIDGDPRLMGQYDAAANRIVMTPNADAFTPLHELTHAANTRGYGGGYMRTIHKDIVKNEIKPRDQQQGVYKDKYEYFASPDEVHARVMVLREAAGFQPNKTVTEEDLNRFLKMYRGQNENINDLFNMSKDKSSVLDMLNFMAKAPTNNRRMAA